jgi:hypothetical protein
MNAEDGRTLAHPLPSKRIRESPMTTSGSRPDPRARFHSLLQQRAYWLLLGGSAFLIGVYSYTSEYEELGQRPPLASLVFVLSVAVVSLGLLLASEDFQNRICTLLGGLTLFAGLLKSGVFGLFAIFSFPDDLLHYFMDPRHGSTPWRGSRLLVWWIFVAGFFWFLPKLDKRFRIFLFVLVMLVLTLAVRSCAVSQPPMG